jgi:isopentenyl-diphosphate Delta-isomerase
MQTDDHRQERVILVDRQDRPIGDAEKMDAHRRGLLHRAVSVFVFDSDGRMLLQRRSDAKYHSGGLWSNTCCTHPRPGERSEDAAIRRLREEMGFTCPVRLRFETIYRAEVSDGLIEHEYDHIFIGRFDGEPEPNEAEVVEYRWVESADVAEELDEAPERYTPWFRLLFSRIYRSESWPV